jgi:hypothetical protein
MKNTLLLIGLIFLSAAGIAQSRVWSKSRIAKTLVESHQVLASNKKVKDGEAFIMNNGNQELARGKYKQGVKDSIWNFYSMSGNLIQVYDYTNAKLLYNISDDATIVHERVEIDTSGFVNPKVAASKKIGGINLGFYLLYNEKLLPLEAKQQKDDVLMEYVFTISETGKLAGFSIDYSSTFFNAENKQPIDNLPAEAYEFIPASINGKPVKSQLVYQVVLNIAQARDRGTYNIPTQKN